MLPPWGCLALWQSRGRGWRRQAWCFLTSRTNSLTPSSTAVCSIASKALSCTLELTLPWLAGHHPKGSEGYRVLLPEQEALKRLHKGLILIQYGARETYGRSATAAKLLNESVQGIGIEHWAQLTRTACLWLGRANEREKQVVIEGLDRWADEAFRFLDRVVARFDLHLN